MGEAAEAAKAKIEALKKRLVPTATSAELLAVAGELEAIGGELARDESAGAAPAAWPRDMNETGASKDWGTDPDEGRSDG